MMYMRWGRSCRSCAPASAGRARSSGTTSARSGARRRRRRRCAARPRRRPRQAAPPPPRACRRLLRAWRGGRWQGIAVASSGRPVRNKNRLSLGCAVRRQADQLRWKRAVLKNEAALVPHPPPAGAALRPSSGQLRQRFMAVTPGEQAVLGRRTWTPGARAGAAEVSPFLACIGSPCLRHRVHGASIGAGARRGAGRGGGNGGRRTERRRRQPRGASPGGDEAAGGGAGGAGEILMRP
jgi:hypothetical protein